MRVLVNALSVSNMSGRHVLLGHLSRLALWTLGQHEFIVLFHRENRDICLNLGDNVQWRECPAANVNWIFRALWEISNLPSLITQTKPDFLFTPAGNTVPGLSLPQVTFAQNPWSLVQGLHRSLPQHAKAIIQRRSYKSAVRNASMMIFNSEFMRQAYRKNAGFHEKSSEVVYQSLDEETHAAAKAVRHVSRKNKNQILSVSAWGNHKGLETLINAVALLHSQYKIPAQLVVAGPWPDPIYQEKIRRLIHKHNLNDAVDIRGYVNREELHQLYAESFVFSLMSLCESFGIPAIEAQAFGTPVVSSNCCAIPEVCGEGGLFPNPGDVNGTAECLAKLLTENETWVRLSEAARDNADKYHWDICSRKLLKIFESSSSHP